MDEGVVNGDVEYCIKTDQVEWMKSYAMDHPDAVLLHCKTKMSPFHSTLSPTELVECACKYGYKAIAITDLGTVQSFPEAYRAWKECREKFGQEGKAIFTKVIYGVEGTMVSGNGEKSSVVLYVQNESGMRNLYRIVTESYLNYYEDEPLIPEHILERYREGLIVGGECNDEEIARMVEDVSPVREGRYLPVYPNAESLLHQICEDRAQELFQGNLPEEVRDRLDAELNAICKNGYAGLYMMWRTLVSEALDKGFRANSRGCVAASLVAYLSGITEINPLSEEYGGYNIPVETLMGLDLDKEPDIEINFAVGIRKTIQESVGKLPGVGRRTIHAGTIRTMHEKTAMMHVKEPYYHRKIPLPDEDSLALQARRLFGTKMCDGCHTGGILVIPEGEDYLSFTPLQHPWKSDLVSSHFEYHDLGDSLLKLNILGSKSLELIHEMQEKTGEQAESIPMKDEMVLELLCDAKRESIEGLPEFGSKEARQVIRECGAKTYDDLIKIYGLLHGTNVWEESQRELILKNEITLEECIASRDDVFLELIGRGMDRKSAYRIMESVRKGKGLTDDMARKMRDVGVPEWYMDVCRRIRYLFPKAHAASYMLVEWRLAYYMIHYPKEYQIVFVEKGGI